MITIDCGRFGVKAKVSQGQGHRLQGQGHNPQGQGLDQGHTST